MKTKFALPENIDDWLIGYVTARLGWKHSMEVKSDAWNAGHKKGLEDARQDR